MMISEILKSLIHVFIGFTMGLVTGFVIHSAGLFSTFSIITANPIIFLFFFFMLITAIFLIYVFFIRNEYKIEQRRDL